MHNLEKVFVRGLLKKSPPAYAKRGTETYRTWEEGSKLNDIFGYHKPIQIEIDEWWYNGRLIQKTKHPELTKYISFPDTYKNYSSDIAIHSTFEEAVHYCFLNPCHNPDLRPENYGVAVTDKSSEEDIVTEEDLKDVTDQQPVEQYIFDYYDRDHTLDRANIFHLYDTGIRCDKENTGFKDARHAEVWIFNTETRKKRYLGNTYDRVDASMFPSGVPINAFQIFSDGSFMVRFNSPVKFTDTQCIYVTSTKTENDGRK